MATQQPASTDEGDTRLLAIDQIAVRKLNCRRHFDAAKLAELAESIRRVGVLQPLVVRPISPGRGGKRPLFELVAGERRFRAAKEAGRTEVPVIVRALDEPEARRINLLENLQREDLSAIEEALAFEQLLDLGNGAPITQQALAERLGCSQPHVANRLRLLKLPLEWQQKVISGEITASQARLLLPLAGHPRLLTAIEKKVARCGKYNADGRPTLEDWRSSIDTVVHNRTERIDAKTWSAKLGRMIELEIPERELERFGVIELPVYGETPERRATNVKAWRNSVAEAEARLAEQDAERERRTKAKKQRGEKPAKAERPKLRPAEQKRRDAQQRRQFAARVARWKTDWIRYLIAYELAAGSTADVLLRLLLYFAVDRNYRENRERDLVRELRLLNHRVGTKDGLPNVLPALAAIENDHQVGSLAVGVLAAWFWHWDDGPRQHVPARDCAAIADALCIDLAAAWKRDQKEPIGEGYWGLHSIEQLDGLARELKLPPVAGLKKALAIERFTKARKALPMPRELARAKLE